MDNKSCVQCGDKIKIISNKLMGKNESGAEWVTDYGQTNAKFLILCDPNSYPNPK